MEEIEMEIGIWNMENGRELMEHMGNHSGKSQSSRISREI